MNVLKEYAFTVLLIIIIAGVIAVFGYAAWNIMQEDTKTDTELGTTNNLSQNIMKEKNQNKISENNTKNNSVKENVNEVNNNQNNFSEEIINVDVNNNEIENLNTEDEELINEQEDSTIFEEEKNEEDIFSNFQITNMKYVSKDGGKVSISGDDRNVKETKMVYNYEDNLHTLEIVYPATWYLGSYNLTGNITVVRAATQYGSPLATGVNLYEINMDEEMLNQNPLEILENKIREYIDSKGTSTYSMTNTGIEQLSFNDGTVADVLKFEYNEGLYYKTYCYCKVEIVDSIMYIATVGIKDDEHNEEMLKTKDEILKSFKLSKEKFW